MVRTICQNCIGYCSYRVSLQDKGTLHLRALPRKHRFLLPYCWHTTSLSEDIKWLRNPIVLYKSKHETRHIHVVFTLGSLTSALVAYGYWALKDYAYVFLLFNVVFYPFLFQPLQWIQFYFHKYKEQTAIDNRNNVSKDITVYVS